MRLGPSHLVFSPIVGNLLILGMALGLAQLGGFDVNSRRLPVTFALCSVLAVTAVPIVLRWGFNQRTVFSIVAIATPVMIVGIIMRVEVSGQLAAAVLIGITLVSWTLTFRLLSRSDYPYRRSLMMMN
mgnify:CR=1 FL=1